MSVIAFACTAASFIEGTAGEENLKRRINEITRIPTVTTSGAVSSALRALNANKLILVTPYIEELNCLEKGFLESEGFQVIRSRGLGFLDPFEIGGINPEDTYDLALELFSPEADGIFISCTNLRTIEIVRKLEERTKRPVVSSNIATFWACLEVLGYSKAIVGFGSLFEMLS
jgi:maleate isomerase